MTTSSPFSTSWLPETLGDLLACSDPDTLFSAMLRSVRKVSPVAVAIICHLTEEADSLEVSRCWTEKQTLFQAGLRFTLGQSLTGRAFAAGAPSYFPDYDCIGNLPSFAREVRRDGVAASLVVPIALGGQPRGSVNFGFWGKRPLGPEALSLFIALARSYGALHFWMEDAAALKQNQATDRAMGQVGLALLDSGPAPAALARALQILLLEAGAKAAALVAPGPSGEQEVYAWCGTGPAGIEQGAPPVSLTDALEALRRGPAWDAEPLTAGADEALESPVTALLEEARSASLTHVALPTGEGAPGSLLLFWSSPSAVGPSVDRLASLAARLLALGLERQLAEVERRRTEEKLRRAQTLEAVGQLAGGVAHDFNNLLGSILGSAYVLSLESGTAAEPIRELTQIRELCKRGGELTRQLLAFAREVPERRENLDLTALVREVTDLLGRTVAKNIRISSGLPESLPQVSADRSMLTTALLNLCLNARDAMPGGGELSLGAHVEGDQVILEVRDTGPGVPEEIRQRIFDPFFTTKPPGKGTGLGLSMVYAACRDHGGAVDVENPRGGGAIFRMVLPAASTPEPAATGSSDPAGSHPLTDKTVLVVEDEDDIALPLLRALEVSGYRGARAATGVEALETLRCLGGDVGLIVLDLVLPELMGDQILRILSGLIPQVPVLVITGREDLAPGGPAGPPLMLKPFTTEEFLDAVSATLSRGSFDR